ncbi:MAG: peptidoglycan-binding protein [Rhodospirillales bacterium]|nr:peptidoglycan-binding protein [Rhodospirillales bacterium]
MCALAAGVQAAPISTLPLPVPPSAVPVAGTEAMPPETQGAYLRGIQKELRAHGYDAGPVDGRVGPRTRAAIRRYQQDAGLPVDGLASNQLLDHLKFALPKTYAFGQPVAGTVLDVQRELAQRDYYLGPQDGLSGPLTLRALEAFLIDAGLPVTRSIDSRLLERIRQAPPEIRRR